MSASDDLVEKMKEMYREQGEEITDEKAREAANNLSGYFDLVWKFAKEDGARKRRLKKEPGGFPAEGTRSCLLCSTTINETNGWYDWYGHTCLLCRKAVKDGVIPTFIFEHHNSYFAMWALDSKFKIKHMTAKKYIREGKLIPRIVLTEDGKPHYYVFLKKENPGLIERYSPERKSYDRSREKKNKVWERKMKAELMEEHRKFQADMKKKYPNLYK